MGYFINLTLNLHIAFIYMAIALAGLNIYLLKGDKAKRKFLAFLPLYYVALTCLAFTGAILATYIPSWMFIVSMVICWLYILITTIKSYKLTKKEQVLSSHTKAKMRKKFYIDLAIFIVYMAVERFVNAV